MLVFSIITLVSIPSYVTAQVQSYTLHFAFDSSNLTVPQMETLKAAVTSFDPVQCKVIITGHTDTTGNLEYNRLLSEQRARSVQAFLTGQGVPAENTTIDYFGEILPVDPGAPAINRRVILQISCPETTSDIGELLDLLAPPEETFIINTDRDTVLITEQGTMLYIRKNSFGIPPRVQDRNVQLLVRDRQKKSSLILENLTTVSPGGNLYTSQLMLHIDARYQGYRPALKKDISVFSPADTIIPGLRLLNGVAVGNDQHIEWNDPSIGKSPVYNYNLRAVPVEAGFILPDTIELDTTYKSEHTYTRYIYPPCDFGCKVCRLGVFRSTKMCQRVRAERDALKDSVMRTITEIDSVVSFRIPRNEYLDLIRMRSQKEAEMRDSLAEIKLIEAKVRNERIMGAFEELDSAKLREASIEDLDYYTFNMRYGGNNLDWLYKVRNRIIFNVNISPDKNTILRVVFKDRRSVVPLNISGGKYSYNGLPAGESAWLVGMRYQKGQPSLALREITISAKGIDQLDFEDLTVEELKERLKILDQWP
jgi:hypothetical protein